jgi:predicted dienelactone hydrolase
MRTRLTLVVALITALLVACGGSGGDGSSATTALAASTTVSASSTTEAELAAPPSSGATTTALAGSAAERYAQPGPFPVGVVELTGGEVPITVFYPALHDEAGKLKATYDLRDWLPPAEAAKVAQAHPFTMEAYAGVAPADPDGGPYPLVVFSHGLAGYRLQSTFLTTHLASWGFVVAAVEHPSRDLTAAFSDLGALTSSLGAAESPDVAQVIGAIDQVQAAASADTGPLAGLAVETTKVGAVGHSAGGFAAYGAAATDPRIVTYVALASPAGGSFGSTPTTVAPVPPPDKPSMLIAGSADAIAPVARVQAAYDALPSPKTLAVIDGVTHLGFMDICTVTPPGQPNVLQVAKDAGVAVPDLILRLFADGCDPKYTAPERAWPAINALTTAQLRGALGLDDPPVVFTQDELDAAFPGLHITLSASP